MFIFIVFIGHMYLFQMFAMLESYIIIGACDPITFMLISLVNFLGCYKNKEIVSVLKVGKS